MKNQRGRNRKRIGALLLSVFCVLAAVLVLQTSGQPESGEHVAQAATTQAGTLTVTWLDVGQGDAAVIQCGGQAMMIDGGKPEKSSYIYAWLQQHGLSFLDVMVATHADADHIGGLSGALNYASVGTAYCPVTTGTTKTFESFEKYLSKQGKSITVPTAGTHFSLGGAQVQILGPLRDAEDSNNASIVLKVSFGATSFLFTGDAEREEEQDLLNSGANLQSTVLKVGHHGSDSSTSYPFLRAVAPQYAVISVGAGNSYGHPTEAVLSRLRDAGVTTFRTDMQGEITAVSDGQTVSFSVEKNASADTLANAGAGQNATQAGSAVQNAGAGNAASGALTAAAITSSAAGSGNAGGAAASTTAGSYVLNTNTHKFHVPNCSSVETIKKKNRKDVNESREQIISEGYTPCKRCDP